MLGELEYRKENHDLAFSYLEQAVGLNDGLNYTEPWAWMHPPRHALGALLLEQGRISEAGARSIEPTSVSTTVSRARHSTRTTSGVCTVMSSVSSARASSIGRAA
ncbi:MAG: hypothetical protein Ct9H300mP16_12940 [Pseudomonadota bacterium]|nr:MAG: hypothetical protein Ct9H300mP16_12940 [Pseudomonadota bacterium]